MKLTKQQKARKRFQRWHRRQEKSFRGRHDYIDRLLHARALGCIPLAVPIVVGRGVPVGMWLPPLRELRAEMALFETTPPDFCVYRIGDGPVRLWEPPT